MQDHYWEICLLQDSPENTTYSRLRLVLSGILLLLIMIVQWNFIYYDFADDLPNTALTALCLIVSYAVYTYAVLLVRALTPRFVQTLTSLFCTHIIIRLFLSPLLLLSPYLAQNHIKNPVYLFFGILYLVLNLSLLVWQFVITAHIYKYALNTTDIQSVLAAFGLFAVNVLTVSLMR